MRLLRRRTTETPRPADETAAGEEATAATDPRYTPGKGRPTPRRREAQPRRTGPVPPPPRTRREAYRRSRELSATRRGTAGTGGGGTQLDDAGLARRDQGPERRTVRDVVDSRRNAAGSFLFVALIVMASAAIPNVQVKQTATLLWLTSFLLMVMDSILLSLRVRRLIRQFYPDTTQRLGGLVLYAINRSIMIRRWRLPKPQVKVGGTIYTPN